jgi:hypothetical protein
MARLVFNGVELNRCDEGTIVLDIVDGFDSEAEVRGADSPLVGAQGRYARPRLKDVRIVRLRGMVRGVGTDAEDREQSYRSLVDELHNAFDPTDLSNLVVHAPYLGLTSGTKTLASMRFVNSVWGPFIARHARVVDVELVSIAAPPDWS